MGTSWFKAVGSNVRLFRQKQPTEKPHLSIGTKLDRPLETELKEYAWFDPAVEIEEGFRNTMENI